MINLNQPTNQQIWVTVIYVPFTCTNIFYNISDNNRQNIDYNHTETLRAAGPKETKASWGSFS